MRGFYNYKLKSLVLVSECLYIEDNTWPCGDTNFIFEYGKYLSRVFITMTRPIFSHVQDNNDMFTAALALRSDLNFSDALVNSHPTGLPPASWDS